MIKQRLLPYVPRPVLVLWRRCRNSLANQPVRSYSFQGEDMVLRWFRLLRRRDINVEVGLGESPGTATFLLSDVDKHANSLTGSDHHEQSVTVEVVTLAALLDGNLAPGQSIDFMSVDVEGHDLEVLLGSDWTLWRPESVLVEQLLAYSLEETLRDPTTEFMITVGYSPIATNGLTCIFRRNESIPGNEALNSGASQNVTTVGPPATVKCR